MTTFASWLAEQSTRQDAVGEIARLWAQISPGRTHSLVGVTKLVNEHAERATLPWVPEAMAATAEEFRTWKVNPEGASIAAPSTRSQLDRIESMLRALLDNLGITTEAASPEVSDADIDAAFTPDGELNTRFPVTQEVPFIKAAGGIGKRLAGGPVPETPATWGQLYSLADHDLPEDTELGETA